MKVRRIPKGINVISPNPKYYLRRALEETRVIESSVYEVIQTVGLLITSILSWPLAVIMVPIVFIKETLESLYYAIKYMTYHATPEEEEAVQRIAERRTNE